MKKTTWDDLGHVKASKHRKDVILVLKNGCLCPTEIADRTGYHQSHVSSTLSDLTKWNLVTCLNPKSRKGRLYALTTSGKRICNSLIKCK